MTGIIPFKTPDGHDELARRTRRLGQRHRTVLLLVDGRRTVDQVLALALAAGVAEEHYRELIAMGLVALPDGAAGAPTLPMPLDAPAAQPEARDDDIGDVLHVELPIEQADPSANLAPSSVASPLPAQPPVASVGESAAAAARASIEETADDDSLLPSVQSLLPDSTLSEFDRLTASGQRYDAPLEEAREILMRAVRAEAPVAGKFILMKIKRASGRAELEDLLDEVEARITRPRKMVAAAQTMRHVRQLLGMSASTAFTIY